MPPNNSPFAGIQKVFFVLLIIGALATLGLVKSDLVNPISSLTAFVKYIKNADQINDIDTQEHKRQVAAEADIQIESAKAAFDHQKTTIAQQENFQQQFNALILEMARWFNLILMSAIGLLAISLSISVIRFAQSRTIVAQAQAQMLADQQKDASRVRQIRLAHQNNELDNRKKELQNHPPVVVPPVVTPLPYTPPFYEDDSLYVNDYTNKPRVSWEDLLNRQYTEKKNKS